MYWVKLINRDGEWVISTKSFIYKVVIVGDGGVGKYF